MKSLVATLILMLGSGALLFAADAPDPATQPATAPSTQPTNKFCAVEQDNPVESGTTVEYKGKTIGFCCDACIATFQEDPEKYLKTMK